MTKSRFLRGESRTFEGVSRAENALSLGQQQYHLGAEQSLVERRVQHLRLDPHAREQGFRLV